MIKIKIGQNYTRDGRERRSKSLIRGRKGSNPHSININKNISNKMSKNKLELNHLNQWERDQYSLFNVGDVEKATWLESIHIERRT